MSHPDQPTLSDGLLTLRPTTLAEGRLATFVVEHDGTSIGEVGVTGDGSLHWALGSDHRGHGYATRAVRVLADWSLTDRDQGGLGLRRIQARVDARDDSSLRVATRSGLRREGSQRVAAGTDRDVSEYVVLARLADDPPLSDPASFRALLNSFLPRKRAISQLLVRDHDGRVLLCQLTYKRDWDLPGGVVEVGESPHLAAGREVTEELALDIAPGRLVLTDWLPPWGGWDDALCLVFDGGVHDASIVADVVRQEREIRDARFLTPDQVRERAADFTARRIESALANLDPARLDGGTAYTESGRPH
ncbi:GNAT family N-acetyltransferase [uncultured Nocardioides sp.]|uniref:NUDIX hydrolase n=1 Tax=uncultured Nocardioides sp. TaxID=198441 RepID=UPI0025ED78F9|nr:GNAT family N-acetyltransferase [uncultured Nocardioides sp.]